VVEQSKKTKNVDSNFTLKSLIRCHIAFTFQTSPIYHLSEKVLFSPENVNLAPEPQRPPASMSPCRTASMVDLARIHSNTVYYHYQSCFSLTLRVTTRCWTQVYKEAG
jgi:hypothetical protein